MIKTVPVEEESANFFDLGIAWFDRSGGSGDDE